jgi:dipeptidyl aminopeptidase/acylaminoacyl peptidase
MAALAAAFALTAAIAPLAAQQPLPPPPIEAYGDLPAIEDAVLSPSGRYSALLTTLRGERVIMVLDAAGAPVKRLVVGDAKVRAIEWVGDDAILLLRTETDRLPFQYGNEKIEWLRGNIIPLDDARPVVSVFANQTGIANAILGFYGIREVDGRWKGFFGGLRMGATSGQRNTLLDDGAPALFAVDLLTGDADLVGYPGDYPVVRDWLIDDKGRLGATLEINFDRGSWKIENADGKSIAVGNAARGEIDMVGFDSSGSAVIYSNYDDAAGRYRRYSVPLSDVGAPIELWNDVSFDRYVYQPYTGRVLGIRRSDGKFDLSDAEKAAALQKTLDAFKRSSYSTVAGFTPDFQTLLARTSGKFDSGTWFRVDGTSGQRAILGLEYPAIQGEVIGPVSTITYSAQDGLEIEAILTLPPGRAATNLPVLIFPHGGPGAHDVAQFDWWAQAFAARGYAVLQPNFRGSTGYGTDFYNAGDGEWGRKMQTDVSDGLAALAERRIADPSRACIMGASYGGYAALAGVTLQQDIYRCAVSVAGVADLEPLLRDYRTGKRDIFRRYYDKQFGKEADLDALSPAAQAGRADAPVLLVHGKDDTVVPYAQSVIMQDALKDAGKPVEFVTLPGEDHYLSQPGTRTQMLKAALAFVEKHNPPD